MRRSIIVGLVVLTIGLAAFAWVVWFDQDDDCGRTVHYQVGVGVDTPQQALRDLGIDPAAVQLTDSTDHTRTYVDGTRHIEVSVVNPGWAVTTDATVC